MSDTMSEEETETHIQRPPIPAVQNLYCIETFDGELIAHSRDGPLVFLDPKEAFAFMRLMEPNENSMRYTVTEVQVRHRQVKSFTDFGLLFMDDLKMPVGSLWFRDFQDGREPKRGPGRPPKEPKA